MLDNYHLIAASSSFCFLSQITNWPMNLNHRNAHYINCWYFRQWIEELQNSTTRVTLLLTQPDYADVILKAAEEYGMTGSVYAWIASTAVSEAMVNI